jgi:hypothetical protein
VGERFDSRRRITDAIQPVSNALYGRRGLVSVTPVLSFGGVPSAAAPLEPRPTLSEPAQWDADAARRLDEDGYGFDRSVDHDHWSRVARRTLCDGADGSPQRTPTSFRRGRSGPSRAATAAAAAPARELERARSAVRVRIPGSAGELVAAALAAGPRLTATPGLLPLDRATLAPTEVAIAGYPLL